MHLSLEVVPDHVLVLIAKLLPARPRDETESIVAQVIRHIGALRVSSRLMRQKIPMSVLRTAVARVLRIALPRAVSNAQFLAYISKDPELEPSASLGSAEASTAILSRLVDFSRQCAEDRAAGKSVDLITRLIESARPALLESLRKATIGPDFEDAERMYRNPEKTTDDVIEQLKIAPYEPITEAAALRGQVREFTMDYPSGRVRTLLTSRFGPLCLWDVSGITDFTGACAVKATFDHGFNSDLFWNTGSATVMSGMFRLNQMFKGYIGTWDVSKVAKMDDMFRGSGIEDSGIASWNTASLTNASSMFYEAEHLSHGLDLSKWRFGASPDMTAMFARSSIVDSGIGQWDVTNANTSGMLADARAFASIQSTWPEAKVDAAKPPNQEGVEPPRPPSIEPHRPPSIGFGTSAMTDRKLLHIMAHVERRADRKGQECSIL
jgi:hypothetical protein